MIPFLFFTKHEPAQKLTKPSFPKFTGVHNGTKLRLILCLIN